MTLRRRMTVLAAASVAVAICLAAVIVYFAVRAELRGQIDESLRGVGTEVSGRLAGGAGGPIPFQVLLARGPDPVSPGPAFVQRITPDGATIEPPPFGAQIPVSAASEEIASSGAGTALADEKVNGEDVRVITVGLGADGAVQIGRSLAGTDEVLSNLRVVLVLVILGGIALAALLARRVADRAIAPITELTETAEHISQTEDLSKRIATAGEDEVGRLASRFNAMLATLEGSRAELARSVAAQRQLVADASHELRTPVASLRTDIEVLREDELPVAERDRMLASVDTRIEDLGALIGDVIELARGDEVEGDVSEVRLDRLVAEAVERTRGHAPDRRFELSLEPSVIDGRPDRLARAVNNLLDNAVKFSDGGGAIEVAVAEGEVVVRDHGPGIPAHELAHVFDRFHRGAGVRDTPGSGLGLAIVRQVAEAHGGTVSAENAPGGGALFRLRLNA